MIEIFDAKQSPLLALMVLDIGISPFLANVMKISIFGSPFRLTVFLDEGFLSPVGKFSLFRSYNSFQSQFIVYVFQF